jgi:glycosyltransferase involved in cell wall biosynthesis
MTLPSFSIITPVYNGALYLEEFIESVFNQNYNNFEHLIIDDGSDDDGDTLEILRKFPHLKFWSRENRGQYVTMNDGLREATGEWVCFISADDLLPPNVFSPVADFLSNNPDVDGLYGRVEYINSESIRLPLQPIIHRNLRGFKYFAHISHSSVYLRRSFLLENQLWFDENLRYNGDYDWFLRVLISKPRLVYLPRVLSSVRLHEDRTSVQKREMIMEERESVFTNHQVIMPVFRLAQASKRGIYNIIWFWDHLRSEGLRGAFRLIRKKIIS